MKKGEESPSLNRTNLETADISIEESASGISATRADDRYCEQETTETAVEVIATRRQFIIKIQKKENNRRNKKKLFLQQVVCRYQ